MDLIPEKKKKLIRWLIVIAAVCLLGFLALQNVNAVSSAISWCLNIVSPLLIGAAIAIIINVPMGFLEKHLWKKSKRKFWCKMRRPIAFLLALIFVIGIMIGVVAIVLPNIIDTVTVLVQSAIELVNRINAMGKDEIAELPFGEMLLNVDWNKLIETAKSWLASRANSITNIAIGTITSFVGVVVDLFLSVVFAGYVLLNKDKLKKLGKRLIRAWLPRKMSSWGCHAASVANVNFKNFISGQFFEAVVLGILCLIGMLIFRFPYAVMISVLVGVTAVIPAVGGFIGGGIGAFMILTVDPIKALWFVVYLVVLQQIEGNLIYPHVMGSRVKLPGIWVLAAVTIGAGLGGPLGMLLSVPIASTVYVLLKEETRKREKKLKRENNEPEIKAILFDLDGTLLPMDIDEFIKVYIGGLGKTAQSFGYDESKMSDAIFKGTQAMIENPGDKTNKEVFWDAMRESLGDPNMTDSGMFDAFYKNEFQEIKKICGKSRAKEIIELVKTKDLRSVLATNPLFPKVATESRIRWAGISPKDFEFYTSYEDSKHAKPNLEYYKDVLAKLELSPEECLMIGNDVQEDMIASELGMKVFLLTDYMINRCDAEISAYPHGDVDELLDYIENLNN